MAKTASADTGYGRLLGMDMSEGGEGHSQCQLTVRPELLNPHGVLHGGAMYSLADNGMGAAVYSMMSESELCATIEIKIVYMAAVIEGVVECETRVLNRSKRIAVLESELRNNGRLVAKAMGTYAIFAGKG